MNAQRAAQLIEAGVWLQMSGDLEGARRLFEQALKLDPRNARAEQLLSGMNLGSAARTAATSSAAPSQTPVPRVPPAPQPENPWAPPPPVPHKQELFDMDWAGATGFEAAPEPAPPAPAPEPVPPPVAPLVPPLEISWGEHATQLMFQSNAEPLPGPIPAKITEPPAVPDAAAAYDLPLAVDFSDASEVPDQPPPVPRAEPEDASAQVRPVAFVENATSAWDSQSNPGVQISGAKPGVGDVMDMVAKQPATTPVPAPIEQFGADPGESPDEEVETLVRGARDLLELDDHSGAMELILKAHQLAPADPRVLELKDRSERTLQAMFESKLGPMSAYPRVVLKEDEIIWLNLDHRAGFVLAQIDGTVTFEDLFEVCGMSRLDTARILAQLVEEGVIASAGR